MLRFAKYDSCDLFRRIWSLTWTISITQYFLFFCGFLYSSFLFTLLWCMTSRAEDDQNFKTFLFRNHQPIYKANVKILIDKLLYYFLHIMFLGILEEKSKAMASALFNTFHSINTSASVLPVLKATAHKYQQRTRSQAGQITRRWRGEAKHQGGERAQDSGTQVSTERKPCSPSADITFFSYNAGTCNPCNYKSQKQQKQKQRQLLLEESLVLQSTLLHAIIRPDRTKPNIILQGHPSISALKFELP